MIALAAELFDAHVIPVDNNIPSPFAKALSFLQVRGGRRTREEPCLYVCTGAADLAKILNVRDWRKRFGPMAVWVIDSFWTDHIPRSIPLAEMFDMVFVTSLEDVDTWKRVSGVPTKWLPWGTDALRLGSGEASRQWDITRVGRQPPEWDDDEIASRAASMLSIKYRPRPASNGLNTLENQKLMMNVYAGTKFVLAFSNTAHPEPYTHPARQYLTGRWVDGLAAGAVIAGVPPKGDGVDQLLWKGATLDFGSIRLEDGLRTIASALPDWSPQSAERNYEMALARLDWRWRFQVVADSFGLNFLRLSDELKLLRTRINLLKGID
jgi:hypothetical protein